MTPVLGQRLRAERAFERLYHRHVGDVYRYSLAILRNPSDAEDVTQTTFLNAYRAYRVGERPDSPRAWLIAIAHNVCRQRFRTASRRVQEVAYEETVAEASVPDPEAPSAEEIQRALGQLAFNQRAALVMRELEGRSYAEIAELLDVSTSAVETLLFRARRALREQLEGSISCAEAEVAISKQLDRKLSRAERGTLRAHLRECAECATLARKQRAQRSAIRALGRAAAAVLARGLGRRHGRHRHRDRRKRRAEGGRRRRGGDGCRRRRPRGGDADPGRVGAGRAGRRVRRASSRRRTSHASSARPSRQVATPAAARPVASRSRRRRRTGRRRPRRRRTRRPTCGRGRSRRRRSRTNSRAVAAKAKAKPTRGPAWKQGTVVAAKPKPKQKPKATPAKPTKAKVVTAKPPTAKPKKPKPPSEPGGNNKGGGGKG